ncbi:MAG: hypothetical protein WCA31_02030 [Acidimicrobiales bacterium]
MEPQSKNIFRIHLGLFLAELFCIPAFVFELFRALGGNTLSWAYVFEWPALGCYAIYMWRRMIREERGQAKPKRTKRADDKDAQLDAWNEYLATVHQQRQPLTPDKRDD